VTPTTAPGALWSRRYGDLEDDRGQGVAADGDGNVVVTGHFDGTTDFGGGLVSSFFHAALGPTIDIYVASYTSTGAFRWARTMGSDSDEQGKAIATDSSGNVLVTGYQSSFSVDFGGGAQFSRGATDIFVAKYSSAGSWVWSKTIGGSGFDHGNAIAAAADGSTYLTGYIGASTVGIDFGGGPVNSVGGSDVFLVKYSATGAHVWTRRLGGSLNDASNAVAVDPSGNVYIGGSFEGTVDFGGGPLSSSGLRDVFVAKFTSAGQFVWARKFGGSGDDLLQSLAADSAGSVALAGKFQGSISFGGTALTSAGGDDAFLARISGIDGAAGWSKRFGATSGDVSMGVGVDGFNNVVVTGYFYGTTDFGGGPLSALGIDVFAAKYSSAGAHVWSRKYGSGDHQIGDSLIVSPSGDIRLSGYFGGTIDFGAGPITSTGSFDAFTTQIAR